MGWLGLGLGQFGSQLGEAKDIAQQWRERNQRMQMEKAQFMIQQMLLPLQMEEMRKRIKMMDANKFVLEKGGEPGAVWELEEGPTGEVLNKRQVIEPKHLGLEQTASQLMASGDPAQIALGYSMLPMIKTLKQAEHPLNPVMQAQLDLEEAIKGGDPAKIAQAQQIFQAVKPPPQPTMNTLVARMLKGDKDAAAVVKNIRDFGQLQLHTRGWAFGEGKLFGLQEVIDPRDGTPKLLDGFTIEELTRQGYKVTGTGRTPMQMIVGVEQLANEHEPAFNQIMSPNGGKTPDGKWRYNLGGKRPLDAYNNNSDRLIFQKIMDQEPAPREGEIKEYMSRVVTLAAAQNLSPEGRALVQSLAQYAEVLGRLRSTLGMQATDKAMALSMGLLPGRWTPDAAYAEEQMKILDGVIKRAIGIPAYSGVMPQGAPTVGGAGLYGPMSSGPSFFSGGNAPPAALPPTGGNVDSIIDSIFGKAPTPGKP